MSDSIGKVYIDVQARADKIKSDFDSIKSDVANKVREIEDRFSKVKIDIDNRAAYMKLSELKSYSTELQNKLQQQIKMNVDYGDLEKTKVELDQVNQKLQGLTTQAGKGGGSSLGNWFQTIVAQAGAAIVAFFAFRKVVDEIKDSIAAYEGREKAMLGIESTIHSMGKEGEYTAGKLLEMAENIAKLNKYSVKVTDILDMQGFLMTLDTMNKDILPKASQLVVDLAAKMKTDLVSAAKSVGIVLEDPEGGLNRLRRAGIVFSDSQKDVIKSLVETGDKAGAQSKIFEVLESKVGGFAKNTTTAFEAFRNKISYAVDGMERDFGRILSGAVTAFAPVATLQDDAIQKSNELHGSFNNLAMAVETLGNKTNKTADENTLYKESIQTLMNEYPNYFKNLDLNKMKYEDIMVAISNASVELDKYTDALIRNALIQDKSNEIVDLGKKRYEALKTQIGSEAIKKDFETKGTIDNRPDATNPNIGGAGISVPKNQLLSNRQILDAQIEVAKNDVKNYNDKIDALKNEIKTIGSADVGIAPGNNTGSGSGSGDGDSDKSKTKVSQAIEDLKFLDGNYYKYKIGLINDEAEARLKDGQDAVAVEMAKYDKLKELAKEYTDFIDKTFPSKGFVGNEKKTPQQLAASLPKDLPIGKDPGKTDSVKETTEQLKAQLVLSDSLKHGFDSAGNSLAESMGKAVQVFGQANSLLEQFINNLGEAVVKSLALAAVNWATGGILGMLGIGAHSGGSFVGTSAGVMKMAAGGSFTVPNGFPRDSFPLWVESGERVSVTPANQVNNYGSNVDMSEVIRAIRVMNANLVNNNSNMKIKGTIGIKGKLDGSDIYLSGNRSGKIYNSQR